MALITLISDYGLNNPYIAALKGVIYSQLPDVTIVDISHAVKPHDVLQTAYLLKHSAHFFPAGSIHLVCVDTAFSLHKQFLVVQYRQHIFIGADNGIFSLLFDAEPERVLAVQPELISPDDLFPDKNVFAPVAARIIRGEDFNSFTVPAQVNTVRQHISPVIEEQFIRGSIVFIDGYGNAITNISRELFTQKMQNRTRFAIFYRRREKITYISRNYHDVKNGYELALFNEAGLLEIAMNTGKADQLLGLSEGSQIMIEFYD